MAEKRLGCKWPRGFEWDLKSGHHFVKTIWNPEKNVQILNGSNFWMVGTIAKSYSHSWSPTIWKQDHLNSDFQKVWISNVSGFWMVGFQIPTVLGFKSQINTLEASCSETILSSWTSAWSLGVTQIMLEMASAKPSSRVFICWIRPNLRICQIRFLITVSNI